MPGWTLAIDFGTTNTAAAYCREGERPVPVRLSDRADQMPSAVFWADGGPRVGTEAVRSARLRPDLFERAPKRRIGEGSIQLGDADVPVTDVVAAVLRHVLAAAARAAGDDRPDALVLTHPDRWAGPRLDVLEAAAQQAGVDPSRIRLVSEPVAAATRYAGARSSSHQTVAVFDYGGGTCDVAVLRRSDDPDRPWDVLASDGADPLGGDGVDHLVLTAVIDRLRDSGHHALLEALDAPENLGARLTLRDEVREAKHALSYHEQSEVPVAVRDHEAVVSLTADEFDALVAADVDRAVHLTATTLRRARVEPSALDVLYLTGGSSHMRAVHRGLSELLGGRPATLEDPKLVVALGALDVIAVSPSSTPSTTPATPAPLPDRAAPRAGATPSGIETAVALPTGLSAPTQRLLTLYPALAAALARHPEGPAAIDDEPMLVALLCAPGLVEQATQDPAVLDRLRETRFAKLDPYEPGHGVPRPVQVFFAGNGVWQRHFDDPAARVGFAEGYSLGAWAGQLVTSWCMATETERGAIEGDPTWQTWVGDPSPDWFHSDEDFEAVTLDPVKRYVPRAADSRFGVPERPAGATPMQEQVLAVVGAVYVPAPGLTAPAPFLVASSALEHAYGGHTMEVLDELRGPGVWEPARALHLYAGVGSLPGAAVVLPLANIQRVGLPSFVDAEVNVSPSVPSGGVRWSGFPFVLTADVVSTLEVKVVRFNPFQSGEKGKWVVVRTTHRPGATCPPSGAELHLRTPDAAGVARRLDLVLRGGR